MHKRTAFFIFKELTYPIIDTMLIFVAIVIIFSNNIDLSTPTILLLK